MIEVLLLRHAPTEWNAERRIQGRADVALSPNGLATARTWRLPPIAADWPCLSSPLGRARQTAEAMGLGPQTVPAFIEMDWGGLEGRRLEDIRAERGEAFAAEEARGLDFRPAGGETPREVGARALTGLRALDANAVIVTHKGVLRALLALATGWDMRSTSPIRLLDGCCHHLAVEPDGALRVVEANIALSRDPFLKGHP